MAHRVSFVSCTRESTLGEGVLPVSSPSVHAPCALGVDSNLGLRENFPWRTHVSNANREMRRMQPSAHIDTLQVRLATTNLDIPPRFGGGPQAVTWHISLNRLLRTDRLPLAEMARLRTVRILRVSVFWHGDWVEQRLPASRELLTAGFRALSAGSAASRGGTRPKRSPSGRGEAKGLVIFLEGGGQPRLGK